MLKCEWWYVQPMTGATELQSFQMCHNAGVWDTHTTFVQGTRCQMLRMRAMTHASKHLKPHQGMLHSCINWLQHLKAWEQGLKGADHG